ncbi:MAG: phosphoadenylyl-sulfate reductase [Smithellaceae bacterium]
MRQEKIKELVIQFKDNEPDEILRYFFSVYAGSSIDGKDRIALASSLGAEDQVLTHMIMAIKPDARIFILDTGRLHSETYDVMSRTMSQYVMKYEFLFPESADVEAMESQAGPDLFYESIENRKQCCFVRKVKPLTRVLSTLDAWITGLRKEQAVTRNALEKIEWDEGNGLIKLNPLADWSEEQVWAYIEEHQIPYNTLHDQGYPSIGCAPCTRAVKPGEDLRSGRWWWETSEQKECGLHVVNGELIGRNK